jgi:hypothetical protein
MAGEKKPSVIQQQPNLTRTPQVYFKPREFNNALFAHGYWIVSERAVRCPCSSGGMGPHPTCENCGGVGFFYIEPRECRALITSLNRDTEYREWSPELIGAVNVTVEDSQREVIEFYNRITLKEEFTTFSETLKLNVSGDEGWCFCTYAPIQFYGVYVFVADNQPLVKISEAAYSVSTDNKYCVKFDMTQFPAEFVNYSISVSYKHRIEYKIIDVPHEVRSSLKQSTKGSFEQIKMPLQGVARRSHLIIQDRPNYDGGGVIENDTY